MEKQGYREAIELLTVAFPGRMALSVKEVAMAIDVPINTVYSSIHRVNNPMPTKRLGRNKIIIPIPALARWIAG